MRKITAFNFVTLNGFFEGPNSDTSWHRHGPEENDFSIEMLKSGNTLLFGRVTYELMASYWTTPAATSAFPIVAKEMNKAGKIVFSRTLKRAEWNNTKVVHGAIVEKMKKMKKLPGNDMAILGSGSIVSLFTDHKLIDEYQIMVDPVVLGDGTPIFKNIRQPMNLKLTSARTFKSGTVLLCYAPSKK